MLWALLAAGLVGGCLGPDDYTSQADREVGEILRRAQTEVLGAREQSVQQPAPAAGEPAPAAPSGPELEQAADAQTGTEPVAMPDVVPDADLVTGQDTGTGDLVSPAEPPLRLDLDTALSTSVASGREFQTRRESLYLQGLSLSLVRFNFGPLMNSTIGFLWRDAEQSPTTTNSAGSFGISQILPSGGTLGFDALLSADTTEDVSGADWNSSAGVSLTQPLLRGAGYEVSHEALTQAERDIVYAVRDFELFREDWSISVAEDYFDLVSRKRRLDNLDQNRKDAVFDREKSESLRQLDRNRDEDVFLARRREINAETEYITARANYESAVDDFKIRLGLSADREVEIVDQEPPYLPVNLDTRSAVEVARANRLDLKTVADRVVDAERSVRIARNGILPDLDLVTDFRLSDQTDTLESATPQDWSASAGVSLGLPLQRQAERNALRSSQISLDRARRDYEQAWDGLERDIVDQLRQLKQTEQQVELQLQQIEQEKRAVAVTQIRYEAGDVDNRDLLDARQSLVDAQNALIELTARHFIARLRLLRNLGVLFIDEEGMWRE